MKKHDVINQMHYLVEDCLKLSGFEDAFTMCLNYRSLCSSLFGVLSPEWVILDNLKKKLYFDKYGTDIDEDRKALLAGEK